MLSENCCFKYVSSIMLHTKLNALIQNKKVCTKVLVQNQMLGHNYWFILFRNVWTIKLKMFEQMCCFEVRNMRKCRRHHNHVHASVRLYTWHKMFPENGKERKQKQKQINCNATLMVRAPLFRGFTQKQIHNYVFV